MKESLKLLKMKDSALLVNLCFTGILTTLCFHCLVILAPRYWQFHVFIVFKFVIELTFPEFNIETEAKVDFPSACI